PAATVGACRRRELPPLNRRHTLSRFRSRWCRRWPRSTFRPSARHPRRKSKPMLHEFITTYRSAIIDRTRAKLTDRPWPLVSTSELEHGVPLFLTQLSETLRLETSETPFSRTAISVSAIKHGAELRELGFNISQVVHDYGDICQAITEVAVEKEVPVTTE